MAAVIIEERNQANKLKLYHRLDRLPVSIGRSFENTVITDDPYISGEHLRIEEAGADSWYVRDCQSENGSYWADGTRLTDAAWVASGDEIRIGDSSFRFFSAEHPVQATLKWHPIAAWVKHLGRPWLAWSMCVLLLLMVLANQYLSTFTAIKAAQLSGAGFGVLLLLLIWSGLWALAGKVTIHASGFHRQLAIVAVVLSGVEISTIGIEYLAFITSSSRLEEVLNYALTMFSLAFILFYSLGVASHIVKTKRMMIACISALLLLLMIVVTQLAQKQEFAAQPEFSNYMKPVSEQLLLLHDTQGFWQQNAALIEKPIEEGGD